jgi:hypothetical protein
MKKPAFVVVLLSFLALAFAPSVLAATVAHTETLNVGNTTLYIHFSEFPLRAERSFDLTVEASGGITGKQAIFRLIQPDGTFWLGEQDRPLPRFPRDRSLWGLDSFALPQAGTWQLEITLDEHSANSEHSASSERSASNARRSEHSARLPLTLLERPAGPPGLLILWLASLPMLALALLAARAWLRVRPLRQAEAQTWG